MATRQIPQCWAFIVHVPTIPLFCDNVVFGGVVPSAAKKVATASPNKPPWTRTAWSSPEGRNLEACSVAVLLLGVKNVYRELKKKMESVVTQNERSTSDNEFLTIYSKHFFTRTHLQMFP